MSNFTPQLLDEIQAEAKKILEKRRQVAADLEAQREAEHADDKFGGTTLGY